MSTYAVLSKVITAVTASVTAIFRQYSDTLWSSHWHNGVDIGCDAGTEIYAVADGVVVDTSPMIARSDGFGNRVILEHDDGVCSLYAHLIKPTELKVGDKVTQGQVIGYVGGTGKTQNSYAPHLHFTLLRGFKKSLYNIFYSNNELLDPIKVCGLGELKFSGSCSNRILENGIKKILGDLSEYYAGYPEVVIPDEDIPTADKPAEPNIKVGDLVEFTGSTHYGSSDGARGVAAKPGKAKVTIIASGAAHPYHLVNDGTGSTVYGWVNPEDIRIDSEDLPEAEQIQVGSTVYVKQGAKTYDGKTIASFVYGRPHIVTELVRDRAVICYGGAVVAAMRVEDLVLA